MLKVEANDGIYTIPYNLAQNTIDLGNGAYYADDMLLLLVKGLIEPNSSWLKRIAFWSRPEWNSLKRTAGR